MSKKNRRTADEVKTPAPVTEDAGSEATQAPEETQTTPEPEKDTTAMREEMNRRAAAERKARERAPLLQVAVETGLQEEPGTAWWPAMAPLTAEERRIVKQTIAKQRAGGYGR